MDNIIEFIQSTNPWIVYIILYAGAYLENLIPPLPGDTVVVFGAYLVGIGSLRFDLALLVTTAGSISGFMTFFYFGRWAGHKIIESGRFKFLSSGQYRKTEEWFDKYGYWIIAVNRFMSGARSVVSFFAGAAKLDPLRVFLLGLISCVVWNLILIYAGYTVGDNWEIVIEYIRKYNIAAFGILSAVVIIYFIRKLYQKTEPRK